MPWPIGCSVAASRGGSCPTATEEALPFSLALFSPRSLLGVPIVNSGEIAHWLVFGSAEASPFDDVALDALLIEVNLAASLIVRPLATRALRDESARQRQAIEGLADVQRQLLPDNPQILGLDYAIHWQPAETAAGDYYDLANLTRHAPPDFKRDRYDIWVVTLADVSGHGAAAAMEAVQFDAILRTYQGNEEAGPAGALTYANRYFFSRRTRHHFLTAVALLYRPDLRRATYVSAGHPPLLHRQGSVSSNAARTRRFRSACCATTNGQTITSRSASATCSCSTPTASSKPAIAVASHSDRPACSRWWLPVRDDPAGLLASLRSALFEHQGGEIGSDDQTLIVLRVSALNGSRPEHPPQRFRAIRACRRTRLQAS